MVQELIEKHAYATNTVQQKQVWPPYFVNHSDDELAFLSYYPLLMLEREPAAAQDIPGQHPPFVADRATGAEPAFQLDLRQRPCKPASWTNPLRRPDRAYVEPAEYDRDACLEWLRDVPSDTHRLDGRRTAIAVTW